MSVDREPTPVEQHLGDRLAALVDGELGHDARERVLSHLATCWGCKAEADAQRRLKSVFADTTPPPPSDGLLARLQGLPASDDAGSGLPGHGPRGSGEPVLPGDPPVLRLPDDTGGPDASPLALDQLPGGRDGGALTPSHGFRVHRQDRVHEMDRSASRGRRLAFAAAGAFSLAALALGGAVGTGSVTGGGVATVGESGSTAGPAGAGAAATSERDGRRRVPHGSRQTGGNDRAVSPAPPPAATSGTSQGRGMNLATVSRSLPLLAGGSAFAPSLIRPSTPPRPLPVSNRQPLGTTSPTPAASAATSRP